MRRLAGKWRMIGAGGALALMAGASLVLAAGPMPGRNAADGLPMLSVPIPPATSDLPLPRIAGPKDASRPLVVIDPGHGGHDPGAGNPALRLREKDVTLAMAKAARDALLKTGRVRVALTREDDRFLVLQERYGIARALEADLFISIHADAAENEGMRGATVYTLSEVASDREAMRLAARENRANMVDGTELGDQNVVGSILIDLTRRETLTASSRFADILYRAANRAVSFRQPYHRYASLIVLKSPDTPSVLFETGYVTNDDEAARLASPQGRQAVGDAIADAVAIYFARNPPSRGR